MNIGKFHVSESVITSIQKHSDDSGGRVIAVMSHSAPSDMYMGMVLFSKLDVSALIYHGCWDLNDRVRDAGSALWEKAGLIVRKSKLTGGNTDYIVRELKKRKKFTFLIAGGHYVPGGKPILSTGYFHIAKRTGARIIVLGFDYVTNTAYCSTKFWEPSGSIEDFKSEGHYDEIRRELSYMYPSSPYHQAGFDANTYLVRHPTRKKAVGSGGRRKYPFRNFAFDYAPVSCTVITILVVIIVMWLFYAVSAYIGS